MTPAPSLHASRVQQGDIVLLEEADLYRYNDGGHVLHDTGFRDKSSVAVAVPTPEPVKYARSVRSHRSGSGGFGNYTTHSTPFAPAASKRTASVDTIPAHYGALRTGGPVNLLSRDYIGLLLNWAIIGTFNGVMPGLVYPLFEAHLGYSVAQRNSVTALFDIGWYFKFVFGFITDNYPIRRQRRKPYIFIGWTVFIGFMLAMAFMNKVAWFGDDPEAPLNPNAPFQGNRYVIPIIISSFAHLLANVSCEGMMVELAHREGEYDRGRTQLWCISFRFIGEVLGGMFAGMGLSSKEYGGDFAHAVPLDWFFATLAIIAFLGNVITYFFLTDDYVSGTKQSFGSNLRRVWRFIEQRVTTQIMVSLFILSIAINIYVYEYPDIFTSILKTDTLAKSLVTILQSTGYLVAAAGLALWFLNTDWRVIVLGSFSIAFVMQLPIEMLTVWDVVRNSALMLGKDWIAGIFEAAVWIVRVMIVVEVSEPGIESTTYGFLTTVCNIANAMLYSAFNVVATTWDKESTDLDADTTRVRWHLTYGFLCKYGIRFACAIIACKMLPRQKRHLKDIKIRGAPNLIIPIGIFIVIAAVFVAAITSSVLSMYESTSCLPFAGGDGCGVKESLTNSTTSQ